MVVPALSVVVGLVVGVPVALIVLPAVAVGCGMPVEVNVSEVPSVSVSVSVSVSAIVATAEHDANDATPEKSAKKRTLIRIASPSTGIVH
jgi:hypothetical protein